MASYVTTSIPLLGLEPFAQSCTNVVMVFDPLPPPASEIQAAGQLAPPPALADVVDHRASCAGWVFQVTDDVHDEDRLHALTLVAEHDGSAYDSYRLRAAEVMSSPFNAEVSNCNSERWTSPALAFPGVDPFRLTPGC